mmetsp:Transcript_131542/g.227861  ORF Transcript_131542/g.227861 Transcript_131542/m.227861 type:complete len:230 (+) Transcript_131542:814-1503(+)
MLHRCIYVAGNFPLDRWVLRESSWDAIAGAWAPMLRGVRQSSAAAARAGSLRTFRLTGISSRTRGRVRMAVANHSPVHLSKVSDGVRPEVWHHVLSRILPPLHLLLLACNVQAVEGLLALLVRIPRDVLQIRRGGNGAAPLGRPRRCCLRCGGPHWLGGCGRRLLRMGQVAGGTCPAVLTNSCRGGTGGRSSPRAHCRIPIPGRPGRISGPAWCGTGSSCCCRRGLGVG